MGSARAAALGHATTALASAAGVHANPASRSTHTTRTVTLFARQSFGLSELRYAAAHWTEPFGWGTLSGGASTFGFDAYREMHGSISYARGVSLGTARRFHAGLTLRYYHTSIEGFGSAGTMGIHAGLLVQVLQNIDFGAHATNLNAPELTDGEALPQTLAVGLSYNADRRLRIVVDAFKDLDFPIAFRGGLEVTPVSILALRAGVAAEPTRFTAGAGVRLGQLNADIAAEQHQELGWSPSASLQVHW